MSSFGGSGGFSFGSSQQQPASNAGFSFGAPSGATSNPTTDSKPAGGFSLGSAPSTGFSFGGSNPATSSASASGGIAFGSIPGNSASNTSFGLSTSAAPASGGFSFGGGTGVSVPTTASTSSFSFGAPNSASSAAPAGLSFGSSMTAPATSTGGLSFGSPATTAAPSAGGFSFGTSTAQVATAAAPAASGFSFGSNAPATTTAAPAAGGFSFGTSTAPTATASAAPASSGFSFGSTSAAPATAATAPAASGFLVGSTSAAPATTAAAAPASSGFSFGSTTAAPATTAAAAPAASGFSFGGTTAASTAPASTTAAASSGFSFGSTTAASIAPATTTAAAPASSGFSFGSTSASASATTPALGVGTSTAPAPASGFSFGGQPSTSKADTTAPAAGGFSFGSSKPADAASAQPAPAFGSAPATSFGISTTGATPAAAAAPAPAAPAASADYSTLDVKSIIQQWYKEAAEDAVEFEKQAQRVSIWDNQLRENQRTLENVVDNVHKIMATQNDLKAACESIEAYQADLEADLSNLSLSLDQEIAQLQAQEPTEADYSREETYLLAEDLNQSLTQMELMLKKLMGDFQQTHGTRGAAESNPIAKIMQILNNHQESLSWMDEKSRGSFEDRLLQYEERRQAKLEKARQDQELEFRKSGIPKIDQHSASLRRPGDVADRLYDLALAKQYDNDSQHGMRFMQHDEATGQVLYKPKINKTSEKIASKGRNSIPIEDSLVMKGELYKRKIQTKEQKLAYEQKLLSEIPKSNPKSERLVYNRYLESGETTEDRLVQPIGKVKEKTLQTISKPTFQPKINENSKSMATHYHSYGLDGEEESYGEGRYPDHEEDADLYEYPGEPPSGGAQSSRSRGGWDDPLAQFYIDAPVGFEDLENSYMTGEVVDITQDESRLYQPEYSFGSRPGSKAGASRKNSSAETVMYERTKQWDSQRRRRQEREKREKEQKELRQCSFKPKIDSKVDVSGRRGNLSLSIADRQKEWLRQKEEKLELERRRAFEEAVRDCTFQPNALPAPRAPGPAHKLRQLDEQDEEEESGIDWSQVQEWTDEAPMEIQSKISLPAKSGKVPLPTRQVVDSRAPPPPPTAGAGACAGGGSRLVQRASAIRQQEVPKVRPPPWQDESYEQLEAHVDLELAVAAHDDDFAAVVHRQDSRRAAGQRSEDHYRFIEDELRQYEQQMRSIDREERQFSNSYRLAAQQQSQGAVRRDTAPSSLATPVYTSSRQRAESGDILHQVDRSLQRGQRQPEYSVDDIEDFDVDLMGLAHQEYQL